MTCGNSKSEGSDDSGLCGVVRMNWSLVICFHQIDCGEDFPTGDLLCKVGNMPNGVAVWNGPSV